MLAQLQARTRTRIWRLELAAGLGLPTASGSACAEARELQLRAVLGVRLGCGIWRRRFHTELGAP